MSARNYHAWVHRLSTVGRSATLARLWDELRTTRQWVHAHLADHTAMQYRIFLLGAIRRYALGSPLPSTARTPTGPHFAATWTRANGPSCCTRCVEEAVLALRCHWQALRQARGIKQELEGNRLVLAWGGAHESPWLFRRFLVAQLPAPDRAKALARDLPALAALAPPHVVSAYARFLDHVAPAQPATATMGAMA